MITPKIPVAKEGYPFIGYSCFVTLIFAALGCSAATMVMLLVTTFVLSFFRDPERFTPENQHAMISPADGKVIIIEPVQDNPFTNAEAQKISIFMNVFNVHVNRIPFSGKVEKIIHRPGKFYAADSSRGALENEYCATVISTPTGTQIAFVQIAGLIARRIVNWLEIGDVTTKGKRFGLIRFGSRVDLYLPMESEIAVKVGDRVRAGETIIGSLHQQED